MQHEKKLRCDSSGKSPFMTNRVRHGTHRCIALIKNLSSNITALYWLTAAHSSTQKKNKPLLFFQKVLINAYRWGRVTGGNVAFYYFDSKKLASSKGWWALFTTSPPFCIISQHKSTYTCSNTWKVIWNWRKGMHTGG